MFILSIQSLSALRDGASKAGTAFTARASTENSLGLTDEAQADAERAGLQQLAFSTAVEGIQNEFANTRATISFIRGGRS